MKLFTHFIAAYFVLLSMFPCPEELFSIIDETTNCVLTQTAADDDCESDCPPFCSCDCCAVQMMRTCNYLHLKVPTQFAVYHPDIQTLSIRDIYRSIWQPPQLS